MLLYAIAIAAGLAATLSCAWAARRLGRARGRWLIWLSSALTAWTVGQTAWTLHRWDRLATVRPMVADVGYLADAGQLAMPVLALAALAAVPASRARRSRLRSPLRATTTPAGELGGMGRLAGGGSRLSRLAHGLRFAGRPATALDEIILGGSLFLLTWSGLLAGLGEAETADTAGGESAVGAVRHLVAVAHPIVVLVLALAVLHVTGFRQPVDLPAVATAGIGLVFLAVVGVWCAQVGGDAGRLSSSLAGLGAVVGALLILACGLGGRRGWDGPGNAAWRPRRLAPAGGALRSRRRHRRVDARPITDRRCARPGRDRGRVGPGRRGPRPADGHPAGEPATGRADWARRARSAALDLARSAHRAREPHAVPRASHRRPRRQPP